MTLQSKEVFNIYVGTEIEQMLATQVLEFSILKHATCPVKVIPLFKAVEEAGIEIPVVTDGKSRKRTPFSFQRFAIPQLNKYQGRALYVDSDMAVFKDVRELWEMPFNGADILSVKESEESGRRSQFSVMVLDCERLSWQCGELVERINSGKMSYEDLVYNFKAAGTIARTIPPVWNCLEWYDPAASALTHFTDMLEQPWLNTVNPLTKLWVELLFEAVDGRFVSEDFVSEQVQKGWVRPSLEFQLRERVSDPKQIPKAELIKDRLKFIAPPLFPEALKSSAEYGEQHPGPVASMVRYLYSSTYYLSRQSPFARVAKKALRGI